MDDLLFIFFFFSKGDNFSVTICFPGHQALSDKVLL